MTEEEKFKVLKAWFSGFDVEYRNKHINGNWRTIGSMRSGYKPPWDWDVFDYRVRSDKIIDTEKQVGVMLNFIRGMPIECRVRGSIKWYSETEPKWNWDYCEYRVARKECEL